MEVPSSRYEGGDSEVGVIIFRLLVLIFPIPSILFSFFILRVDWRINKNEMTYYYYYFSVTVIDSGMN